MGTGYVPPSNGLSSLYNFDVALDICLEKVNYMSQIVNMKKDNIFIGNLTQYDNLVITDSSNDSLQWCKSYYGLTATDYNVIVLSSLLDGVLQGFTSISVNYDYDVSVVFSDAYLLNQDPVDIAYLKDADGRISDSFIDYRNGLIFIFERYRTGVSDLKFSSTISITEHKFICIAKSNKFNTSINPSSRKSLTEYADGFTNTYVSTVGIYDDNDNLLVVAKLSHPIKKSDKIDTVFSIQIDM